jgi:hypothetical protein
MTTTTKSTSPRKHTNAITIAASHHHHIITTIDPVNTVDNVTAPLPPDHHHTTAPLAHYAITPLHHYATTTLFLPHHHHHCHHTTLTHQHGDTNTETAPEPDRLQSVQPKCYRCWVRLRTMYYIYSMYVWRLLWLFVKLRNMKERLVGPL